jgi:hypothetical protein
MRLRGRAAGIDGHNALRLSGGDRQVATVYAGKESAILLLEAVLVSWFFRVLVRTFVRTLV